MWVLLSNCRLGEAKDLFHALLNVGLYVITLFGINGIFPLVREDPSESNVIPILLDIASDNQPSDHQQNESIDQGSNTPNPDDVFSNLPTPCYLINFDGENFRKFIPKLGKGYEEVDWEVLPDEFQNGCQKLLKEMKKADSRGKVFNIIVLDPDEMKMKWQKKASNFLRNTPFAGSFRGKKSAERRLSSSSINLQNQTVHKQLIKDLNNLHEDNWKEYQRELEKAKNDRISMEKEDIPTEMEKVKCQALKKVQPHIDKIKQTYPQSEMTDNDKQESVAQILELKAPAEKEAQELQNEQIGLYDNGLELRIKNLEARFYFRGLEEQIKILKKHYERRRLEKY